MIYSLSPIVNSQTTTLILGIDASCSFSRKRYANNRKPLLANHLCVVKKDKF
jgi:hypothetical protein